MTELSAVHDFWNERSCGEVYASGDDERASYEAQRSSRYALEPYLIDFAKFHVARGKDVLEIGVGMGADHLELARQEPKSLTGIDLTERAVEHARRRLNIFGLSSEVMTGNAEALAFPDSSFDLVYSWGVIHHSPDTPKAVKEIHRVLRSGGVTRIMIYHRYSLVGAMLWVKYGFLKGRPATSMSEIYASYLESPGTKAYTIAEAKAMFSQFSHIQVHVLCSFGDLLEGAVGQRHGGIILKLAKALWPRAIIKWLATQFDLGLYLLIEARK